MSRTTRIDYNHSTRIFSIVELVEGEKCHYQTKNIWQVIQRLQDLACEVKQDRHWTRGAK